MLAIAEAADIVYLSIEKKQNATKLLANRLKAYKDKNLRARINLYVKNYLRKYLIYDAVLKIYIKKRLSKQIKHIILMSISIIIDLQPDTPGYYINATVNIMKKRFGQIMADLTNAILHNVNKNYRSADSSDFPENISLSYPAPLYDYFIKNYSDTVAKEIMRSMNNEPHTNYFYINSCTTEELEKIVRKMEDKDARIDIYTDSNYMSVTGSFKSAHLPNFLIKMDLPFIYAVNIIKKYRSNGIFMDGFAGIGNKFLAVCDEFDESIAIENKLVKLQYLKKRLNIPDKKFLICSNTAHVDFFLKQKVDFILLDVPCTGFGSICRKPDIRYHYTIDDANFLMKKDIIYIEKACSLLNQGGYILYVTCTLTIEENEMVIDEILKKTKLRLVDISGYSHEKFIIGNKYLKFLPIQNNITGSFVALLKK